MRFEEIIYLIVGISATAIALFIHIRLREEKLLKEGTFNCWGFEYLGLFLILHAFIFPWAYFEEGKVKEGWIEIAFSILLFFGGIFLIAKSLS